jgi:hypothetical protein
VRVESTGTFDGINADLTEGVIEYANLEDFDLLND